MYPPAFETQMLLHDAAGAIEALRIRPAQFPGEAPPPILAVSHYEPHQVLDFLAPALDEAWPDRPSEVDDLDGFLVEAQKRVLKSLQRAKKDTDFVPATLWPTSKRHLLFEHLRQDLRDVIGGIDAEALWEGFASFKPTEALHALIDAGIRIKLRSIGSFLVSKASRFDDELTADQFFAAGDWARIRNQDIAAALFSQHGFAHKQVAHLTVARPLPEDRMIYRAGTHLYELREVVTLLQEFAEAVDDRLVPDWWKPWVVEVAPRVQFDQRS